MPQKRKNRLHKRRYHLRRRNPADPAVPVLASSDESSVSMEQARVGVTESAPVPGNETLPGPSCYVAEHVSDCVPLTDAADDELSPACVSDLSSEGPALLQSTPEDNDVLDPLQSEGTAGAISSELYEEGFR